MRIVAGERRGMRLRAPGHGVRPTSDRVREAIFSLLGDVSGLDVLDAFAGTGALGLEALSRGAARASFCERDAAALRALRGNVEALGYGERCEVRRADARRCLAADAAAGRLYHLLLLDPPYTMLAALEEAFSLHVPAVLVEGGIAVVESDAGGPAPGSYGLAVEAVRTYGGTTVTLLRRG